MTSNLPTSHAIDVQKLHKSFGDNEVLKGIDFHVDDGEVVCVIGPSGSGKSTLLRCINRLEVPTKGRVLVEGVDMTDPETDLNDVRSRIGMVFQSFNLFPHLTVTDNLTLAQRRVKKRSKADARQLRAGEPRSGGARGQGGRLPRAPLRRPAAAGGDRPGAVDGARPDALRRADQRPGPRARRRRARGDEDAGLGRA